MLEQIRQWLVVVVLGVIAFQLHIMNLNLGVQDGGVRFGGNSFLERIDNTLGSISADLSTISQSMH